MLDSRQTWPSGAAWLSRMTNLKAQAQAQAVPRRRGRPRTRSDMVLADKAYSSREIRIHLR